MNNLPFISIVTPSYNQADFLVETIESVISQDYSHKEYLIIDGESSDGSADIIRRYEPSLAYWVSEPDKGQAHAINKGFALARGEILAWLNSDDFYYPGALTAVAETFAAHPEVDLVYGDFVYIDAQGQIIRSRRVFPNISYNMLLFHDYLGQPAVFFRRSLLDRVGLLDENLYYCLDWDLFLRMWRLKIGALHLPKILATYRLVASAKSHAEDSPAYLREMHLVQQRHMNNRFRSAGLNRLWYRWLFYCSFAIRAWSVIRDDPLAYIRTYNRLFEWRRILRLWNQRLKSPY
jgi:glycosyltransferase involved in cell wall biosynthesis